MSSLLERGIKVLELLAGHPEGLALSAIATAGNLLVERNRYLPRAAYRDRYDDMAGRFVLAHERLGPVFISGPAGGNDG